MLDIFKQRPYVDTSGLTPIKAVDPHSLDWHCNPLNFRIADGYKPADYGRPAPLPDVHSELQDIRQGIADIKALFASRPNIEVFPRVSHIRSVKQTVNEADAGPRLCPMCGKVELKRRNKKYCSDYCRKQAQLQGVNTPRSEYERR